MLYFCLFTFYLRLMSFWLTARRRIPLDRPLVMGILNVTLDSFSDGGNFLSAEAATRRAEEMIGEGADMIDIGGESTRPGSIRTTADEELKRVVPIVEELSKRFDIPLSIDTTKAVVAENALASGAEIINDISGLRFDPAIAETGARYGAGFVLMHSRGDFENLHSQPAVTDILSAVMDSLRLSIDKARAAGLSGEQIAIDIGLGFGKTFEQNLELLAKLDTIVAEFDDYPVLVGASRKSFIGKILNDVPPDQRLGGSIGAALAAIRRGAKIVRVHDVRETVSALRVTSRIDQI
jgi:dihydropteroate synthase